MEPVPVTRRVRRTVRMAVALVVGQAMLCALIGWLTLGRHRAEPARPPRSSVVDQLAIPPLTSAAPPPSRGAISATALPRPASAAPRRAAPARSTADALPPPVVPATGAPQPINAPPDDPQVAPPSPPPPPPPLPSSPRTRIPLTPVPSVATPTPSTSPEVVQEPVRVGDECRPLGAYGRTGEGDLVRCLPDGRDEPRWKIV
ncbi:MAG: hypothetical protein SYR96_25585 [Actinomycetota bacterium]|nr:hypothetical protein [Actinomycetota bacterium]